MNSRQKKILDFMQYGRLVIKDAAEKLQVTEMTVRRDLKQLADDRKILLVKGGAVPYPVQYEPELLPEDAENTRLKMQIAAALYRRILPTQSLFLSSGSTTLAFARLIARQYRLPLTVITNSLPVASTLFHSSCKVILLGGELRSDSLDLVGPAAEQNLQQYHVDWLVSGCDGAFSGYGFYTSDLSLSNLEQKSIRIADHTAVITDSSKFSKKALTRFASLQDIDLLVTDHLLTGEDRQNLMRSTMEIITAPESL